MMLKILTEALLIVSALIMLLTSVTKFSSSSYREEVKLHSMELNASAISEVTEVFYATGDEGAFSYELIDGDYITAVKSVESVAEGLYRLEIETLHSRYTVPGTEVVIYVAKR